MLTSETGGQPVNTEDFNQPDRSGHYWQSPSGNISCNMDLFGGQVRCLISQIDFAGPATCEAGPIFASLDEQTGAVTTACGGDAPELPGPAKALEFGQSISEFDTACSSTDHGMTCKDLTTEHGFTLARAGLTQF
jgi:hypothetical protein